MTTRKRRGLSAAFSAILNLGPSRSSVAPRFEHPARPNVSTTVIPVVPAEPTSASWAPPHDDDVQPQVQDKCVPSVAGFGKDYMAVGWSLASLLLKRVPDFIDKNPVKIVFALANSIIEINGQVAENRTSTEQQIVWTSAQLLVVEQSLAKWSAESPSELEGMKVFERKMTMHLQSLIELKQQSLFRRIATHEDLRSELARIFEQVNQAREELLLQTGLTVHRIVHAVHDSLSKSLLRDLKPSEVADYKYHPEGQQRRLLRRDVCTPGTRVQTLESIRAWANDISATSESVYWLFGSAGSGKSTIAFTVVTQMVPSPGYITLGGNFFSSRQFEATRHSKRIIPTIAYQLAHQCPSFAEALAKCDFNVIHQGPRAQLEKLFVEPWLQAATRRTSNPSSPLSFLVVIDALDEIEGDGGADFLRHLLEAVNNNQLPSLKFFVTSRPNPTIVRYVHSFWNKRVYRLEEIPPAEARADIETYLCFSLPHFKHSDLMQQLVELAAGLFIFAATVVKHLTIRHPGPREQRNALKKLVGTSSRAGATNVLNATRALDQLYTEILVEAFANLDEDVALSRLRILHAFICAAERTSTTVVSRLLSFEDDSDDSSEDSELNDDPTFALKVVADDVVQRLYSVLYVEDGKVLAYHKSFPDFILDRTRSAQFWCNQATQHELLARSCLGLMASGLRFNIARIPSSYVLDEDNATLQEEFELEKHIPLGLRYACHYWAHHLERIRTRNNSNAPLLASLADFIDLRALFWIETMNILGFVGLCDPMLRMACDFIPPEDTALRRAFGTAANFALYYSSSPASWSTPHLYLSALPTWPHPVFPISKWKSHFPGAPCFTNPQSRSPVLMTITSSCSVWAVANSDDGKLLASGSESGLVQIWDASVGRLLEAIAGHTKSITSISFFHDNARIVTTSSDETIRMWEAATGRELGVFRGHCGVVWSAAVSPDDTQIVSGSEDTSIRIWDTETGSLVKVLEGHAGPVGSVAFSSSMPRWIISASEDGTVGIWDATAGQIVDDGILQGHEAAVACVAFSPDNWLVASGSDDDTIRVWDVGTRKQLAVLNDEGMSKVWTVGFSRDGSKLVSSGTDTYVRIWDTTTWGVVGRLGGHTGGVPSAAFSFDGRRIVSASFDGSIRVWDASTSFLKQGLHAEVEVEGVVSVAASYDGAKLVSAPTDVNMRVWDGKTGRALLSLKGHTGAIRSVAFVKDAGMIFSAAQDRTLRFWDSSTGELLKTIETEVDIWSASVLPNGSQVVVGSEMDSTVRVWDVGMGKVIRRLEGHTLSVGAVAFSRDNKYVGTGSADTTVRVWDRSSGEVVWILEGHNSGVTSVAFSQDSSQVASGSTDRSARLWDTATGECVWVLDGHSHFVTSIAFSPDGTTLASSSTDKTIRLWDTGTGLVRSVLEGHTAAVMDVTFSPDGRTVISCSDDTSIRIWGLALPSVKTHSYTFQKRIDPRSGLHIRTGWLLDDDGRDFLMYIPPEAMIPDPSNTLIIPPSAVSSVSFSLDCIGPKWAVCYSKCG